MKQIIIRTISISAFFLAGCTNNQLNKSIESYALIISENSETTIELIERCKGGDQKSCDFAIESMQAIKKSAEILQNKSKE